MKKTILSLVAMAFAIGLTSVYAARLKGMGTAKCAEIVESWDGASYELREKFSYSISAWAFGYLSGRNIELPTKHQKNIGSLDGVEVVESIIAQCRVRSDAYVIHIVDGIFTDAPSYMAGT